MCRQLYVVATDNGMVRRSASVRVRVTVVRNRNGPVFSQSRYNVTVDETVSVSQSLVRVTASDADGVSGCGWQGGSVGDVSVEGVWIGYMGRPVSCLFRHLRR